MGKGHTLVMGRESSDRSRHPVAPHIAVHVSVEAIMQTANAATVIRGAVAGPMITKAAGPRINAKTGAASYIPYVITATLKRARG